MIKASKKEILSIRTVLSKITPYDIYKFYCPVPFSINKRFKSPMPGRQDSHPSFLIGLRHGKLSHVDFADSRYNGDCFDFVQQIRLLPTIKDALVLIDKDFGLGISSEPVTDRRTIITYEQPEIVEKKPNFIQVLPRSFNSDELAYWKAYHQDKNDLEREQIYAIKELYMNKDRIHLPDNELIFGYFINNMWKIYRPQSKDKDLKWYPNNVYNDTMEGREDIYKCEKAIIAKSRKDRMVIKKVFPYVASVQNESLQAFDYDDVIYIKEQARWVYIAFDSDAPGKKNSHIVTEEFGFLHINTPDELLPDIKDFAEMGKIHGLQAIEKHFKLKGIL